MVCTRLDEIQVFTDGSGLNKQVSVAAVASDSCCELTFTYHLGPLSEHTAFEGEFVCILLGLHLLHSYPPSVSTALITLDNQAAIIAITNNICQPSQYLLEEIHVQLQSLQHSHHWLCMHFE